jgi:hypothetical protein
MGRSACSTGYWRGAVPWQGSSSFYYAGVGIAIYKQMKDNIASVLVQFMALDIKELLDINKKDDRMNI